jgi:tripartite-type tricarboxylate transporter receptor subunit TctC
MIRMWIARGLCALLLSAPASAEPAADFYRGKTVSIYVGFPPAGGYDIYARVFAPYFSRHIPGNPAVTIRNMEGGSGVRAAAYITHVTPQDGTSLGCSSTPPPSASFSAGRATSIPRSSYGSAASPRPTASPWSGTPRRRRPSMKPRRQRSPWP